MNIKEELLIKQAQEGYTVCYIESCPLRDHCLRWLVGQHLPNSASTYRCVNPHFESVATAECPMCRNEALPIAPTTSNTATARASSPLPYRKTSATCFAKADGQTK